MRALVLVVEALVLLLRRFSLQALVVGGALSLAAAGHGQAAVAAPAAVGESYPQVVRIRAVEGDVRISRTDGNGKATGEWEQAVNDVPLESGFSVVTGDGRAEIEFEDASTLYLDKNSGLTFDDLHTTDGVPHSEVSLLTGTCTAYLHPAFEGEMFVVKTPTDRVRVVWPNKVYERITGYLDAVAITHLQAPGVGAKGAVAVPAVTVFHNDGKAVEPVGESDPAAFAEWDAWVASRVAEHEEAAKDVAEMSGLVDSTPGLADMEDAGVFFPCAPYGTCWVPTAEGVGQGGGQDEGQIAAASAVGQGPEFQPRLRPSAVSIGPGDGLKTKVSAVALLGFADPVGFTVELPQGFRCVGACSGQMLPGEEFVLRLVAAGDVPLGSYTVPVTMSSGPLTHVVFLKVYVGLAGEVDFVPVVFDGGGGFPCGPGGFPPHLPTRAPRGLGHYGGAPGYAWAVCHTGSWIYRQHRYVWVIDRRHHPRPGPPGPGRPPKPWPVRPPHHPRPRDPRDPQPPIKWIKWRGKDVWVPRHPDDVDGRLPENLKHAAFRPVDKGRKEEEVKVAAADAVEPLEETPREFVEVPLALERAGSPMLRAYATGDRVTAGGVASVKTAAGSELRFSRESRGFVLARTEIFGGKTRVVTESLEQHRSAGVGGGVRPGAASGGVAHAGGVSHGGGGGGATHAASSGSHVATAAHVSAPAATHSSPPPATTHH